MSELYFKLPVHINLGETMSSQHPLISLSVSENNMNLTALYQIKETWRKKQKEKLS